VRRFFALLLVVAACGNGVAPDSSSFAPLTGPSQSTAATGAPTVVASTSAPQSPRTAATPLAGFDFRDDDEVQARHILISPNHDPATAQSLPANDPAWDVAHRQAEQVYAQVAADPSTFGAIAATTSDDAGTREAGGLLPYYARSSLIREFADAIFATDLAPGQVLAPIRSSLGWHVIQFVDRRHAPKGEFTCGSLLQPATPADPLNGQVEQNMGAQHVQIGTTVGYAVCPPASGQHYSAAGKGPIAPRFYGPDDRVEPQSWVHNLEHGGLVVLYRCGSSCPLASIEPLRSLLTGLPASPTCSFQPGQLSPVIARFDEMAAPFAAVLWNRLLFLDSADTRAIAAFYSRWDEQENPEHLC
jgi:hypothetical protein